MSPPTHTHGHNIHPTLESVLYHPTFLDYTSKIGDGSIRRYDCRRCEHTWQSSLDHPVRCPKCGSYRWSDDSPLNSCLMCGHRWYPRTDGVPLRCPRCKTRSWCTGERKVRGPNLGLRPEEMDIMDRYNAGEGCIRISLNTGTPLSSVFDVVKKHLGDGTVPRM